MFKINKKKDKTEKITSFCIAMLMVLSLVFFAGVPAVSHVLKISEMHSQQINN